MLPIVLVLLLAAADPAAERERAWALLRSHVTGDAKLRHLLSVESIMREMAARLGEDRTAWGLAGLLHDIDLPVTEREMARHGVVGAQWIAEAGFGAAVAHAVASHEDATGVARASRLDHALFCADQTYWLVRAAGPARADEVLPKVERVPARQAVLKKLAAECPVPLPRVIGMTLDAISLEGNKQP